MRLNELIFSPEELVPKGFFEEISVEVPQKSPLKSLGEKEERKWLELFQAALQGRLEVVAKPSMGGKRV